METTIEKPVSLETAKRKADSPATTCSPMKEDELRRLSKCAACGRKIGQTQIPILWKLTLERHFLDLGAIQRQNGLAMMLGGNGLLARVMGADEDMTKPIMDKLTVMICDDCSCKDVVLAQIAEDSGNEKGQP